MVSSAEKTHLRWLVEGRSRNQEFCLQLLELVENHQELWTQEKYFFGLQDLTGAAFSLWRAVFLGEKEGTRKKVVEHVIVFLRAVVLDNAIAYAQDKKSNEWTFNYYVENARVRLQHLRERWPDMLPAWQHKTRTPHERWDYAQSMLDKAITSFEKRLAKKR